jgi:hypothetical protein
VKAENARHINNAAAVLADLKPAAPSPIPARRSMNDTLNANILRIIHTNRAVTFATLVRLASPQLPEFADPDARWWERNHINQVLTIVLNELLARQSIQLLVSTDDEGRPIIQFIPLTESEIVAVETAKPVNCPPE